MDNEGEGLINDEFGAATANYDDTENLGGTNDQWPLHLEVATRLSQGIISRRQKSRAAKAMRMKNEQLRMLADQNVSMLGP